MGNAFKPRECRNPGEQPRIARIARIRRDNKPFDSCDSYHYGQNSCFLAKISRGSTTEDTEHTERRTVPKGQRFPRSACPWSNRVSHVSGRYVRFRPQFLCHRQSRAPKHSERTSVFSVNSVVIPSFHRVRLCRTGRFVVPPRSVAVLPLQGIRGWHSSPSVPALPAWVIRGH